MTDWKQDKRWSDRFIPEIKQALVDIFVCEAPEYEDQRHNTDLMVFMMKPARVACRIRRYQYYDRYPNDITIRKDRPSGVESEMAKLISGFGDYLFYGFSNSKETALCAWSLLDLSVFRLWISRYMAVNKGVLPGKERLNGDKSSTFQAFDSSVFPDKLIYKKYAAIEAHR